MNRNETTPLIARGSKSSSPRTGGLPGPVLAALGLTTVALITCGLFFRADPNELTAEEKDILQRISYEAGKQNFDHTAVEVDLGFFDTSVIRPDLDRVLRVRFELVGVISGSDKQAFQQFQENRLRRFRSDVIRMLSKSKTKSLSDPQLLTLRSQIIELANKQVDKDIFMAIVFGDYALREQ